MMRILLCAFINKIFIA